MSVTDAVGSAIERRGPAMLLSTLTLMLGFSVFGLSNFFVNVTLGLLTALVFSVGLLWDLLVTPSLLMLIRPLAEKTTVVEASLERPNANRAAAAPQ